MGNRLDNMTEDERETRFDWPVNVGTYFVNRAGSVEICRIAISRLQANENSIIRLLESAKDEEANQNRASVLDMITEQIIKLSEGLIFENINPIHLLHNRQRFILRQIEVKKRELKKIEKQINTLITNN